MKTFSTRFSGQMSQPFLSPIVGSNNQKIRLFEVQFAREGMHMQCCDQFRGIEHVKVRKWALRGNLCLEGAMSTMMAFISAIFFLQEMKILLEGY